MDNRNTSRVSSLLATAEGQEQYLNWFKDEITQVMLAAARELAHPRMTLNADASYALQENGRIVGAHEIIDFFTSPTVSTDVAATPSKSLKPTYGSEQILQEQKHGSEATTE